MRKSYIASLSLAALLTSSTMVSAADPVTIGFITTLSGPLGYAGEDIRDGFQLAIDEEQGKLGGVPVRVVIEDDGTNAGRGRQIAEKFIKSEKAKVITGLVFTTVLEAAAPDILDSGAFLISPNAGPSNRAGRDCDKNYFVVSWENTTQLAGAGLIANALGYKKMFAIAPNFQAGKEALEGFKRTYNGQVLAEVLTRLDTTDFAPQIAQIRASGADALFAFQPGGLGIAFMKQYVQAGLRDRIPPVLAITAIDSRIRAAIGDAGLGLQVSMHYNEDFDNPANRAFVKAFRDKYKRAPDFFAVGGYDAAKLIASGLKVVNGDMSRTDDFRDALRKADFNSVRGKFAFGANHHPIQDWYQGRIVKNDAGEYVVRTEGKLADGHRDPFVSQCKM